MCICECMCVLVYICITKMCVHRFERSNWIKQWSQYSITFGVLTFVSECQRRSAVRYTNSVRFFPDYTQLHGLISFSSQQCRQRWHQLHRVNSPVHNTSKGDGNKFGSSSSSSSSRSELKKEYKIGSFPLHVHMV